MKNIGFYCIIIFICLETALVNGAAEKEPAAGFTPLESPVHGRGSAKVNARGLKPRASFFVRKVETFLTGFTIPKVTQIEKQWVIPPDQRTFLGNRGLTKYDYGRPLPVELRGEDYIVALRYHGPDLTEPVVLKFFYYTVKDIEKLYIKEYSWPAMQRGNYTWTLKNIGSDYLQRGKVDRWKTAVFYRGEVVAEKRSATWKAMGGMDVAEETVAETASAETIFFD